MPLIRDTENVIMELRQAKLDENGNVITVAWSDYKTKYSIIYPDFRSFCNSLLSKYITGGE